MSVAIISQEDHEINPAICGKMCAMLSQTECVSIRSHGAFNN